MNWFDLLLLFLFVSFFFFKEKHLNFPYGAKIGGIQIAFNRLDLDVYKDGDTPQEKNWAATHTGQIKGTIWKGSCDFITSFIIIPEQKIPFIRTKLIKPKYWLESKLYI